MSQDDSSNPFSGQVACEVCLSQVPHTEAQSMEGADYVLYFCGLDCYDQWYREGDQESESG